MIPSACRTSSSASFMAVWTSHIENLVVAGVESISGPLSLFRLVGDHDAQIVAQPPKCSIVRALRLIRRELLVTSARVSNVNAKLAAMLVKLAAVGAGFAIPAG